MPAKSEGSAKAVEANEIVTQYMFGSFAAQMVPSLPFLDHAVQSEVQLRLVRALATHYEVEFLRQRVRGLLRELIGVGPGGKAVKLLKDVVTQTGDSEAISREAKAFLGETMSEGAQKIAGGFVKSIVPGARLVLDYKELAEPLATLYAVGRVFITHFECHGTICTFDATRVKGQFAEEVQIGRKIVEFRALHGQH